MPIVRAGNQSCKPTCFSRGYLTRNEVKVKGHMAGYLLRRNCSRWVLEHLGPFAEETLLGHSGNTRDRNYVNRASVDARRIGHHRG